VRTRYILWAGCLAGLCGCGHEAVKPGKAPTPVNVSAVELFTPATGERYSASILPARQVSLAFRVSGFVASLYQVKGKTVEIGEAVGAGTVLAQLRKRDYDLQVEQAGGQLAEARQTEEAARFNVAQAEAAAAKAGKDFERATFLFERQSLTRPDYDAAQAQRDATRAQAEAARAQAQAVLARIGTVQTSVANASLAREDTVLTAPFAGSIVQRNVEIGSLVGPGVPAFVLADLSSVKASFGVPDSVVVEVRRGMARPLSIEALPGQTFQGVVTSIAAVADPATRLFQVDLTIANPRGMLKPGMIAALSLATNRQTGPVPVVPLAAIVRGQAEGAGFAVLVVQDGVARRRPVTLGPPYGDRIAVTTGLEARELVVSHGASLLTDGEKVEVIR
jgi:RND family efflux transporter MFP subunit